MRTAHGGDARRPQTPTRSRGQAWPATRVGWWLGLIGVVATLLAVDAREGAPVVIEEPPARAVDLRGCGWFVAYDPPVVLAVDAALDGSRLDDSSRRVLRTAVTGQVAALRAALTAGAAPDVVVPGFDYTPLTASVSARCAEATRTLLDAGASPNLALPGRQAPLSVAVSVADSDAVTLLLQAGADPDKPGNDGLSARDLADILGDPAVLEALSTG